MRQVVTRALALKRATGLGGLMLRQSLPVMVVIALLWVMRDRVNDLDFDEIGHKLAAIQAHQWFLAVGATAASFWAIGRYDEIVHAMLRTRVGVQTARTSGISAVAISQFAGFGALTATLVRWRMLPDTSLTTALKISAFVTLSFLLAWAFVTSVMALFVQPASFWAIVVSVCVIALGIGLLAMPSLTPVWPTGLPSTAAMLKIVALVAVDLGFAAMALYILLPTGIGISIVPFFLAFSIALMAGLMSGTPGGFGAFELCMLAQLPLLPDDTMVAATLAFRLVYHLLPALLATALLILGPRSEHDAPSINRITYPRAPHLPAKLAAALWQSPFAEAALVRQGDFGVMGANQAIVAELGQSLVALNMPLDSRLVHHGWLVELRALARSQARVTAIYKAPPRVAAHARRLGWRALPIAREAIVTCQNFTVAGREHRQLRRMLRKADLAGITIAEAGRDIPMGALTDIASDWKARNSGERAFSMGRFCPHYISFQRIFIAWQDDRPVAFVTFHEARAQWTLDLMRSRADAPDGTMHALVTQAIEAARNQNVPHLSLAASRFDRDPAHWISRAYMTLSGTCGLHRFKASFAPTWQTRYALAPGWIQMALALWDVSLRIHRRAPLKLFGKSWLT